MKPEIKTKTRKVLLIAFLGCWWGLLGVRILHEGGIYPSGYWLVPILAAWSLLGYYPCQMIASWVTWPKRGEK